MIRSFIALTGPSQQFRKIARSLQALLLARPGLLTRVLAIVAFFSIGLV